MKIAFWSNVHGQTSTTSNLMAVSIMMALEYRMKLLITHNDFYSTSLENALIGKTYNAHEDFLGLSSTGIDAMLRFIKSGDLNKDNFANYTTSVLKNKLDLLKGTNNLNKAVDLSNEVDSILTLAQSFYDGVLVDVAAGTNELSGKILQSSDVIVINLNQNVNVLDSLFEMPGEILNNILSKSVFLISRYDKYSLLNIKNIKKKYNLKKNIAVIPYNIEFSDACSYGKATDFFLKNVFAKEDDYNYFFISEVRNAVKIILSAAGIDFETKRVGD